MIRHVVLLKWKEEVSVDEINAISGEFGKLALAVPQIKAFSFGPDAGFFKGNLDYALVADFDDEVAFKEYVANDAHQEMMKRAAGPMIEFYHAVQFQLET